MMAAVLAPPVAAVEPGPIHQRTRATVTADTLPTAQINGVVWSQAVADDVVYAGGEFTSVRPAGAQVGTSESPRSNLMSYSLSSGVATSFAPDIDGVVKVLALSADRSTLYVGGQFAHVNGLPRMGFASFAVATGELTPLAPNVNATVNAIAVRGRTVYLGGNFNRVNGLPRTRLAAVNADNGALTGWAPTADATVQALVAPPGARAIVAGGSFARLNQAVAPGMGSLDAVTGESRPWAVNQVVQNSGENAAILTLAADHDTVYGGGYTFGDGNFEGVFAADAVTGDVRWLQDCHGDTYDVVPIGDQVYSVGHAHFCSNIGGFPDTTPRTRWSRALAVTKQPTGTVGTNTQRSSAYQDFAGHPAPSLYNWFPDVASGTYTGLSQAAWSVTGTERYLVLGGEFPRVNGRAQQGLARFAVGDLAPNRQGPRVTADPTTPTVSIGTNQVSLSWRANWDRDDQELRYQVLRNGAVISADTATSHFWRRPALGYVDRSGRPGASYRYQIRVQDGDGNTVTSPAVVQTYPSDDSYARRIRFDGAKHQWRLGSPSGSTSDPDGVGGLPLTADSGVTFGARGALRADADSAATFNGGSAARARTASSARGVGAVSIEGWVKTTSSDGGALMGFGPGDGSDPDAAGLRQVRIETGGQVSFSVRGSGAASAMVTSPRTVADGGWHAVVAVQTATHLQLYLDGRLVATRAMSFEVPAVTGRWGLGGPAAPAPPEGSVSHFAGTLDDVSVFPTALTPAQAYEHHRLGSPRFRVIDVARGG